MSHGSRKKLVVAALGIVLLGGILLVILGQNDSDDPQLLVKEGSVEKPAPGKPIGAGATASVEIQTSRGSFTVKLDTERSPVASNNFAYLAQSGFYDGLGFHRIVPGFVIQGGDPRGDGSGGPGYREAEAPDTGTTYPPGTVAMAKAADEPRGSFGSQFFIVTAGDAIDLPPDYAVVGKVASGFMVVSEIGRLGGPDERPTEKVVIESANLSTGK